MTTKYDVGDIVLLPFRVNFAKVYGKDKIHYSVSPVGDDPHTGVISESQIAGALKVLKTDEEKEIVLRDALGYYG